MADQVVQTIVDWIYTVDPLGMYLLFFIIAYLENVMPPAPGDVVLAFGGYLAADGLLLITPLWILTVVASVAGFMTMYWFGAKLEDQISANRHDHFILKFFNYKYITKGKVWMNTYGQWVVFGNRFLAGTRSVISLTAGMSHLKRSITIINATLSSMLWNGLLLGAGWFVKDNWQIIGNYLSAYGKIILIGLVIVALARILWVKRKTRKTDLKK